MGVTLHSSSDLLSWKAWVLLVNLRSYRIYIKACIAVACYFGECFFEFNLVDRSALAAIQDLHHLRGNSLAWWYGFLAWSEYLQSLSARDDSLLQFLPIYCMHFSCCLKNNITQCASFFVGDMVPICIRNVYNAINNILFLYLFDVQIFQLSKHLLVHGLWFHQAGQQERTLFQTQSQDVTLQNRLACKQRLHEGLDLRLTNASLTSLLACVWYCLDQRVLGDEGLRTWF